MVMRMRISRNRKRFIDLRTPVPRPYACRRAASYAGQVQRRGACACKMGRAGGCLVQCPHGRGMTGVCMTGACIAGAILAHAPRLIALPTRLRRLPGHNPETVYHASDMAFHATDSPSPRSLAADQPAVLGLA